MLLLQSLAEIPNIFFRRFRDQIPNHVWLRDPVGNEIEVVVDRGFRSGYFTFGWDKLESLYGLERGGWIQFSYVGQNVFNIGVLDLDLKQIEYPHPPVRLEMGYQYLFDFNNAMRECNYKDWLGQTDEATSESSQQTSVDGHDNPHTGLLEGQPSSHIEQSSCTQIKVTRYSVSHNHLVYVYIFIFNYYSFIVLHGLIICFRNI